MNQPCVSTEYDLLIRNATLIDGTGARPRQGDLAVAAGRIAQIAGPGRIARRNAAMVVAADGLVLAPGFIDSHTHDDFAVMRAAAMRPKITQGVTTVVVGNCG